jgi:hypothetical protein
LIFVFSTLYSFQTVASSLFFLFLRHGFQLSPEMPKSSQLFISAHLPCKAKKFCGQQN